MKRVRQQMFKENRGDREEAENVIILITDGKSKDPEDTETQAFLTRMAMVKIIAIGVGAANEEELKEIATDPDSEHVYLTKGFNALFNLTEVLGTTLCLPSE